MVMSAQNYTPAVPQDTAVAPGCCHHWVIDTASGPTSQGTCRLCGESREFRNFSTDVFWKRETLVEAPPPVEMIIDEEEDTG